MKNIEKLKLQLNMMKAKRNKNINKYIIPWDKKISELKDKIMELESK